MPRKKTQRETQHRQGELFLIALAFLVVLVSGLLWLWPIWISPRALMRFGAGYWTGLVFSALVGGWLIGPLVSQMQREISDYIRREHSWLSINRIRPFVWFPAVFGYIERSMYTASYLIGEPEFIGVWLIVKTAARWALPKTEEDKITDSRHRYYPVLIGNLLNVAYGVAGALVIQWLRRPCGSWRAFGIMLVLMVGTLSLILYESYKYKNWLQNKETWKP